MRSIGQLDLAISTASPSFSGAKFASFESFASKAVAAAATTTAPSPQTLRHVKERLIHLNGTYNLQRSSTFTSSSSKTASDSDTETVTSYSSASKQRRLGRKGRYIPAGGLSSDPALALDITISLPPFSAVSVRPLSALLPSLLSSSRARLLLSIFYCQSHPRQKPSVSSADPLYVLLSGPPATIISLSSQNLVLPLIHTTSTIFYPYNPHSPPLYITPLNFYLYIYLSIYISKYISIYLSIYLISLTLSFLSLVHSLSLYISPQHLILRESYSFYHYPFYHYLNLYLCHTLSLTLSDFYRASA